MFELSHCVKDLDVIHQDFDVAQRDVDAQQSLPRYDFLYTRRRFQLCNVHINNMILISISFHTAM